MEDRFALNRQNVIARTIYGSDIYAHILRLHYPGDFLMKVSGDECGWNRNPWDNSRPTLHIWIERLDPSAKLPPRLARHHDTSGHIPDGDALDFAARYWQKTGDELLQVINDQLHLGLGRERRTGILFPAEEAPEPKFSFFKAPISTVIPYKQITVPTPTGTSPDVMPVNRPSPCAAWPTRTSSGCTRPPSSTTAPFPAPFLSGTRSTSSGTPASSASTSTTSATWKASSAASRRTNTSRLGFSSAVREGKASNGSSPSSWTESPAKTTSAASRSMSARPTAYPSMNPARTYAAPVSSRTTPPPTSIPATAYDPQEVQPRRLAGPGPAATGHYHRISRFYPGYTEKECDDQYDRCLRSRGHGITPATLFHLAKAAGIDIRFRAPHQPAPKLSPRGFEGSEGLHLPPPEPDDMPTFSQEPRGHLPGLLEEVARNAHSDEDADLLILGSLVTFSACLPRVHGVYGGRRVYPNLFLFVTAPASAGKGRLTLCRRLVQPIHDQLRALYRTEMEEYRIERSRYEQARKKNPDLEPPEEPKMRMLIIPANSSPPPSIRCSATTTATA